MLKVLEFLLIFVLVVGSVAILEDWVYNIIEHILKSIRRGK